MTPRRTCSFVLVGRSPRGDGRRGAGASRSILDERADESAAGCARRQILSGQAGGPPEALGGLIGEMLGVKFVPDQLPGREREPPRGDPGDPRLRGRSRSARIPRRVRCLEITGTVHPMGSNLPARARASERRFDDPDYGLAFDNEGKNGTYPRVRLGRVAAWGRSSERGRSAARAVTGRAALLLGAALVTWIVTIERMRGMDAGPGHRPRLARLVPRRLGDDDGRDDAAVGRADGARLLAGHARARPPRSGATPRRGSSSPATSPPGRPTGSPPTASTARSSRPIPASSPGTSRARSSPAPRSGSPASTS